MLEVSKWHRERLEWVHSLFIYFASWPSCSCPNSCLVFWSWPYRWTKIKHLKTSSPDALVLHTTIWWNGGVTLLLGLGNSRWIIPGLGKPVFRNSQCIPGNLRLCGCACAVSHCPRRSILPQAVSVSPVGCLYNQTPLFFSQPSCQVPYKQSSLKWWYSAFSSSFLNWMS